MHGSPSNPAIHGERVRWSASPSTAALCLLLAAACGPASAPRGSAEAPDSPTPPLGGTEWVLLRLDGQRPLAGTQITMEAEPEGLGGYDGCNWYGARYTAKADTIDVAEVSATARGCTQPPGVMDQEQRYTRLLGETRTYAVSGDTLRMKDAGGRELLAFLRRHKLAMDPAALVGTRWRLERMVGRPWTPGTRVTLGFGRDSIRGFAGCRSYTGEYRARGDRIGFPSLAMVEMDCADRALLVQEGDFTTTLTESAHYRLAGGRLELYTLGGDTLWFTAER